MSSFGESRLRLANGDRIPVKVVKLYWFERADPEAVRAALEDEHDTIGLVHHETTTGLLNDENQTV